MKFVSTHNQAHPVADKRPRVFLKFLKQSLMGEYHHHHRIKIQFYIGFLILRQRKPTALQLE